MSAVLDDPAPILRDMRNEDVPEVAAIENETYAFPWSQGIFLDCLCASYLCRVLERDNLIAGYAIMAIGPEEAHILNLCVRSSLRRRGYGQLLLQQLLEQACDAEAQFVFLEVRPSNRAAVCLYEDAGFTRIGSRKSYYRSVGGREDAVVLALELANSES